MTDALIEGFKKFRASEYEGKDPLMPRLVREGQTPDYFVISCIDSRTNTGTIFNAAPGTFFTFMAMGAIVRPYQQGTALAAALQFALTYCGVKKVIVLGHTQCGGIRALAENIEDPEIASFIDVAKKGLRRAEKKVGAKVDQDLLLRLAEQEIVLQSAENLKTYLSVQQALAENRLEIHPWVFDMRHGALLEYDPEKQGFRSLTGEIEGCVTPGICGCAA